MQQIKTSYWFNKLPEDHLRIGISRGTPRNAGAGFRIYRKLAPGPWFNSVEAAEYYELYRAEILSPLNPREVAAELIEMAGGRIPTLLCFERPNGKDWCHRAMAAEWLNDAMGWPVPEFGFEQLAQYQHPLMPAGLRRSAPPEPADLSEYIGRSAVIGDEKHTVVRLDETAPGRAIVVVGVNEFSTSADTLRRHFT